MPDTSEDAASLARHPAAFQAALLAALPHLNAFAISLCGCRDKAKDLVQEAVLRAWKNQYGFRTDCDIKPWLFAILRNVYFSEWRRGKSLIFESFDAMLEAGGWDQPGSSDTESYDFAEALALLPPDQREVMVLIVAEGLSYEEAAAVCGCRVGTIKSRLSRARARLAALLELSEPRSAHPRLVSSVTEDFGDPAAVRHCQSVDHRCPEPEVHGLTGLRVD